MNSFQIGIIVKPQGIRGELRVFPTTDDPGRFSLLIGEELLVTNPSGSTRGYKLLQARQHKGIVIIKLEGIDDRNAAEQLMRSSITIPQEMALPLGDDEYYVRDLVGMKVETETGEPLGTLTEVLNTNANDVYVITDPTGESFMIPAIKDVVLGVAAGKITVRLLDGLRELKK